MTRRELQGFAHLAADATEALVNATERVHRAYARRPFAVLERIGAIAKPVKIVEDVESAAASTVYATVRALAGMSGILIDRALAPHDEPEDSRRTEGQAHDRGAE